MTQARAPRADAIRNRAKVLVAAREQITLHGPEIGMDEIAAAAGVAVGTIYRNFPTKTDLVAAVVGEYTARVAADAEAALERATQGARAAYEVAEFLGRVVEASATDHAVKTAARTLGADHGDKTAEKRATTALDQLIRTAQADGDIHPDITVDDIYLLFNTAPTDQPAAIRDRWLALVLRALTTHGIVAMH